MKAYDFEFDNERLSSRGFMLCSFDEKGLQTVSNGATIVFNVVPSCGGTKQRKVITTYEDVLECEPFQICKNVCNGDSKSMEISSTEFRELTKWLNRKNFLKFKILDSDHIDLYYMCSFVSISRIEIDGKLVGVELQPQFNAPFAYKEKRTINIKNLVQDGSHSFNDISHEEGYIYPHTEITINESGNLNIHNAIENRDTYIANCVAGEVITLDYPIIESSISSHKIQNDFNWNFFRVANTYDMSRNDLTISIPCTIKIEYSPIVKVGI